MGNSPLDNIHDSITFKHCPVCSSPLGNIHSTKITFNHCLVCTSSVEYRDTITGIHGCIIGNAPVIDIQTTFTVNYCIICHATAGNRQGMSGINHGIAGNTPVINIHITMQGVSGNHSIFHFKSTAGIGALNISIRCNSKIYPSIICCYIGRCPSTGNNQTGIVIIYIHTVDNSAAGNMHYPTGFYCCFSCRSAAKDIHTPVFTDNNS